MMAGHVLKLSTCGNASLSSSTPSAEMLRSAFLGSASPCAVMYFMKLGLCFHAFILFSWPSEMRSSFLSFLIAWTGTCETDERWMPAGAPTAGADVRVGRARKGTHRAAQVVVGDLQVLEERELANLVGDGAREQRRAEHNGAQVAQLADPRGYAPGEGVAPEYHELQVDALLDRRRQLAAQADTREAEVSQPAARERARARLDQPRDAPPVKRAPEPLIFFEFGEADVQLEERTRLRLPR